MRNPLDQTLQLLKTIFVIKQFERFDRSLTLLNTFQLRSGHLELSAVKTQNRTELRLCCISVASANEYTQRNEFQSH